MIGSDSIAINPFNAPTLEGSYNTAAPIPGQAIRASGGNRQFVRFYSKTETEVYTVRAQINEKTGASVPMETGVRPIKREFVEIVTPGDTNKYDNVATSWHKRTFWRQYQAFREGRTAPLGMPIEQAQFVSNHLSIELRILGVHTVEQLADASEDLCNQVPDGFQLREFARAYCKAQIANKDSPKVIAMGNEIEMLKREIAAMKGSPVTDTPALITSPVESIRRGPTRPKSEKVNIE